MPNGQPTIVVPGQGWVDLASRIIVQVGFPVVVAGVLLWFLLTRFQENMNAITKRMEANAEAVGAFITELKQQTSLMQSHQQGMNEQLILMKKIEADAAQLVLIHRDELDLLKRSQKP